MPRPEPNFVTFDIDGREVSAPEGAMLVDGAKYGDVEIPVFCYEPKLGAPVGACRMCLVEIEGIPKLQTACSTPVKAGMTVITGSDRVKQAQNAVVEFLLVNHPLDCPVCDKGGECPLQDVSYGWGAGRSRMVEPKRHFKKPLELSPLVAIDRERCILCFRCVRFSQEISEDYQLVFVDRGDHTYVGTHDGHPYVAPFTGNILELCPVGALTSTAYRFRARPWDVEGAGSICTLCPSQCNVEFTVRDDEKVLRVIARDHPEVDDGWLCDKGRFGYQAIHSPERLREPLVRDGGTLRPVSWERALSEAAAGLGRAGAATGALVGGEATNEEGFLLQRLLRERLGSSHVDARAGGLLDPAQARLLAQPDLTATVSDIDYAGTIVIVESDLVEESPILDLRVRKAARRGDAKVVLLTSRPGSLDATADVIVRFAPGAVEAALGALAEALDEGHRAEVRTEGSASGFEPNDPGGFTDQGSEIVAEGAEKREHDSGGLLDRLAHAGESALEAIGSAIEHVTTPGSSAAGDQDAPAPLRPWHRLDDLAGRAGSDVEAVRAAAALLGAGSGPTVVLWGERSGHGSRGRQGLAALLAVAGRLELASTEGSGLLEVPAGTNARGLREVGCLPNLLPGLADAPSPGMPAAEIARALGSELSALILLHTDPLRTHPERGEWAAALERAEFVISFSDFLTPALEEHASVVFPAESYAEREGTVTHPDGRLQRVRQAIGHPGQVRATWSVLADIAGRLERRDARSVSSSGVTAELLDTVPFYAGLTLEEIGGRGVRWPERAAASALPAASIGAPDLDTPPELPAGLRLGTIPTLWAGRETEHAPVLRFLAPRQRAELSAEDALRLGIAPGDEVSVGVNGTRVHARAALRQAQAPGTVFLMEGTEENNATALTNGAPRVVDVLKS